MVCVLETILPIPPVVPVDQVALEMVPLFVLDDLSVSCVPSFSKNCLEYEALASPAP